MYVSHMKRLHPGEGVMLQQKDISMFQSTAVVVPHSHVQLLSRNARHRSGHSMCVISLEDVRSRENGSLKCLPRCSNCLNEHHVMVTVHSSRVLAAYMPELGMDAPGPQLTSQDQDRRHFLT